MARWTFIGGIHPNEGKELAKDKPIEKILPQKVMVYPLSQSLGAMSKAIVKKGDRVLVGQMIAENDGFMSVPIHSSVSGTVLKIADHLMNNGRMVSSIFIENDQVYETYPIEKPSDYRKASREEILDRIQLGGVAGMGGAGFPTHVKLNPKNWKEIDRVIINCAECEPYLTSDYRRMLENTEDIIGGLEVVLSLFPKSKGILAVEDNKPDCITKLKAAVLGKENMEVVALKTKYPQGAERQLIYASCGRAIHSQQLPGDAGCIVLNVDTVEAVYRSVVWGYPLIYRILTVSGDAVDSPGNFKVPIGTSYEEILECAGGLKEGVTPAKVISGGPMMGSALYDLDVPVTKVASALLCFKEDVVSKLQPMACIRCGRCVEVCPGRVMPTKLAELADRHDMEAFLAFEGLECCSCGCCSYVCPSKRHLTQSIAGMRNLALAYMREKKSGGGK